MKISINKTKLTAIIVMVILTTSMFMLLSNSPVQAQTNTEEGGSYRLPAGVTPDYEVDTTAYLSFRPNPVGLGQVFLVNMWTTPALHVSRYHSDYKLTITKPSGEQHVVEIDSYRADATAWLEWVADEVGDWKLKFEFQGSYFPAGNYTSYGGAWIGPQVINFVESAYYRPSSTAEQTLTVQEQIVNSWPESPLPTDYWTRPVSPENREWWPILGYFPSDGVVGGGTMWNTLYPDTNIYYNPDYEFFPYVQAPNTAHIAWRRQENIGGLIGGPAGQKSWTSGGNTPSIIYAGRCYDSKTRVFNGEVQNIWTCTDVRTGEVYWERTDVSPAPSFVMLDEGFPEVPGAAGNFGRNIFLCAISGGKLLRYNPTSGNLANQIDIAPLTSGTLYDGTTFLSVQNLGGGNYRLIKWTLAVENLPMLQTRITLDVLSNITFPWSNLGSSQDYDAGIAATVQSITQPALGAYTGTRISAASLTTGALLWDITVDETMYSSSTAVADHGKIAFVGMDGRIHAYYLSNGQLAWRSEAMDYPWSKPGFGAYDSTSAYGMLFRQGYDGVYAFDWSDGHIVWHYKAPTPYTYETPYIDSEGNGVYSFNGASMVADGKLYTYNTEHTPSQPITRGWRLHCIDVFTGEGIWNITGCMTQGAVADGYLTASNSYDGYTYVFGKGKSTTTVSAPETSVPKGTAVLITGSVLDQSPAQPGTPCVSTGSMTIYMEYLHMQKPIPSDFTVTGVPVMLLAIDSDNNVIPIGETTSDMSGKFAYAWTPSDEGLYKITATFLGDDSYGSSWDETAVVVGPAPSANGQIIPEEQALISTDVAIIIAVAAVAVIGAVAYLALKKRK